MEAVIFCGIQGSGKTRRTRRRRIAGGTSSRRGRPASASWATSSTRDPPEAIRRNEPRPGKQRIPIPGILGPYKRFEVPRAEEGFDALYRVKVDPEGGFLVKELEATAGR